MARKISCFVSLSTKDENRRDIQYLIDKLQIMTENKVDFLLYYDQRTGSNLQEFMKHGLRNADAVILLGSPDYKDKCKLAVESGLYTEFKLIVDRLDKKEDFLFIPIYWRGKTFEESVPEYFHNRNYAQDIHKFAVFQDSSGENYLPEQLDKELRPAITKIVTDLILCWQEHDPDYRLYSRTISDTMLPRLIYADENSVDKAFFSKSERSSMTLEEFNNKLFVKTAAFNSIDRYHKSAFTGRKGSGKTTLLKMFKYRNKVRYLSPIDVEVNDWSLHDIIGDLTFRTPEGDLSYTAHETKIFDFVWPVFLGFCMVRSLVESLEVDSDNLIQSDVFARKFKSTKMRYDQIFILSVEYVKYFFQNCIDASTTENESAFSLDLVGKINLTNCTFGLLGSNFGNCYELIANDQLNRKILFCFDRFDTEIQKYRKDMKARALSEVDKSLWEEREVYWIQGLVEMIDLLRSPDLFSMNQDFYKKFGELIDFCVPLPRDRLYEVQQRRRAVNYVAKAPTACLERKRKRF
jgi:TIR domain